MQETFQIALFILCGTLILVGLAFLVIFSVIQYRKANRIHQLEKAEIKSNFEKEVLEVKVEVQKETLGFVSEEIHDNIGQVLSLVRMSLPSLADTKNKAQVEDVSSLVDKAIKDLRNLSHVLSQNELEDSDLSSLIEGLAIEINRIGRVRLEFSQNQSDSLILDSQTTLVLFRIVQEAVNNAIKYSQCDEILVNLEGCQNNYTLVVNDDGVGFEMNENTIKSNGLQNMRKRAELINGEFRIESQIGVGTKAEVKFALNGGN